MREASVADPPRTAPGAIASRALPGLARRLPLVWLGLLATSSSASALGLLQSPVAVSSDGLSPPGLAHILGTDELGRDVFSRVCSGAALSVQVATVSLAVALVVGTGLGSLAATTRWWAVEQLIMRSMDAVLAFPPVVLALLASILLGSSVLSIGLLIGVVVSPQIARLVRGRLSSELKQGYVVAERSTGASTWRILTAHVARNMAPPLTAYSLLLFADTMLVEATLSFVGVGIQPPQASWGNMILEGQKLLLSGAWWVSVFPGLALFLTVVSVNAVAERFVPRSESGLVKGRYA